MKKTTLFRTCISLGFSISPLSVSRKWVVWCRGSSFCRGLPVFSASHARTRYSKYVSLAPTIWFLAFNVLVLSLLSSVCFGMQGETCRNKNTYLVKLRRHCDYCTLTHAHFSGHLLGDTVVWDNFSRSVKVNTPTFKPLTREGTLMGATSTRAESCHLDCLAFYWFSHPIITSVLHRHSVTPLHLSSQRQSLDTHRHFRL